MSHNYLFTPGNNSKKLIEQASRLIPGGVNSPVRSFKSVDSLPFVVDRGEGAYLFDCDGNRYVDFINSWGPLVLGHAPSVVVEALQEQLSKGTSYGASCELEQLLARKIQQAMPSIEMLRFVSSGTEAGMSILRLARGVTGRNKIIKFNGCYHGHVDSLLVEAGSGVATLGIPGSAGVPEAFTKDTLTCQFNNLTDVEALFSQFPDQIAAVILEPVMGNSGLIPPVDGYLQGLRELSSKYGALLIFDEVMTGFRVHPGGAQALYGIDPDLTMLGKVIGGGLPVGAFGGKAEYMQQLAPLGPVYQAGTLSGNPLAMTAGLHTLEGWMAAGVFDSVASEAERLVDVLRQSASKKGIPFQARSLGTMFGFFFRETEVVDYAGAKDADGKMFNRFFSESLKRGVFFAPSSFEAGFVSAAHIGEPIDYTCEVVEQVIADL